MLTFVIGVVVVVLVLLFGMLLAFIFARADRAVQETRVSIEQEERAYNPAMTLGYRINTQADKEQQVQEARRLAAKRAAALPRGANMRIGRKGEENLATAHKGVEHDPITAVKIAAYHGWDGVRTGIPAGGVPQGAPAAVAAAPAKPGKIELVPGKDYPYIEITDDMPPEEVRKARIANAKAKSAAYKAAKEAAAAAPAPAAVTARATPQAAPVAAAPVGIEPPKLIEITDDMPPDEVRKARIANSKARSAFNKALKDAGIDPNDVEIQDGKVILPQGAAPQAAAPQPTQAPVQPAAAPTAGGTVDLAALGVEAPQIIEITDDMDPNKVRQARIANSKARSAFNKALKQAGIDPSTVEITDSGEVVMKEGAEVSAPVAQQVVVQAAETTAQQPAPAPAANGGGGDFAALGVTPPDYIEITDDMDPDDVRKARVHNAKERSRVSKALKAAGADPKDFDL